MINSMLSYWQKLIADPFYRVLLIYFFTGFSSSFLLVFGDTLFLLTYPSEWLAYLFFLGISLRMAFVLPLNAYLETRDIDINIVFIWAFLALTLSYPVLYPIKWFWLPFCYILGFYASFSLLFVVSSNAAASNFTLQKLKKHIVTFEIASTTGATIACFALPFLIDLSTLQYALYFVVASLAIILLLLWQPAKQIVHEEGETKQSSPFKYPLARRVFFLGAIPGILYIFLEYSFKNELALHVTPDLIPEFLGWTKGSLNLIVLVLQVFAVGTIIRNHGLYFFSLLFPISMMIASLFYSIHPTLLLAMAFYATGTICHEIYDTVLDLTLNALPHKVRVASRLLNSSVFYPLGLILSSVFLIVLPFFIDNLESLLSFLGASAFVVSVIWLIWTQKILPHYQTTLKACLPLSSFTHKQLKTLFNNFNEESAEKVIVDVLNNQTKSSLHALSFAIISKMNELSPTLKNLLLEKIGNENEEIQMKSIQLLQEKKLGIPLEEILNILQRETKQSVIWALVKSIVDQQDPRIISLARQWKSRDTFKCIYGCYLLMITNQPELSEQAAAITLEHTNNPDPQIRLACAQVLGEELPTIDPKVPLEQLMQDSDFHVSFQAKQSAARLRVADLLPQLIDSIRCREDIYHASQAILAFGELSVPFLLSMIEKGKSNLSRLAIETLALIEGPKAESALLSLVHTSSLMTRTIIARCLLDREKNITHNQAYYSSFRPLILEEFKRHAFLKQASISPFPSYLAQEIQLQLNLASLRYLCWYAIFVDTDEAQPIVALLNSCYIANQSHIDKALEILSTLTREPALKRSIDQWNDPPPKSISMPELLSSPFTDTYLKKMALYAIGHEDAINEEEPWQKVVVLRECALFCSVLCETLYGIADTLEWHEIAAGELLFAQGDYPDGLYIVSKGEIDLIKNGLLISTLGPHSFFGEIDALSYQPRLTSAYARTNCTLLHLDIKNFNELVLDYPEILVVIAKKLISYVYQNHNQETIS